MDKKEKKMESTELRLGNYITTEHGNIGRVIEIKKDVSFIYFHEEDVQRGFGYKSLSGIPLTPEILETCGFEDWSGDQTHAKLGLNAGIDGAIIFAYNIKTSLREWVDFNGSDISHIQFLHQLENLYHSLTGTDLQVNLA